MKTKRVFLQFMIGILAAGIIVMIVYDKKKESAMQDVDVEFYEAKEDKGKTNALDNEKDYLNSELSKIKIPQPFYGTWEVTDVIYLAGQTPQDYIGKIVSFSEEDDISFQAQELLKDGEHHLLVYFQFADKDKQRKNPFSAFVVKSSDEITFITHSDIRCSAKKILNVNKESGQYKKSMSVEDILKADLCNRKCCNESYLYKTIAGKWQVESGAYLKAEDEELLLDGELEIYSDENSLSPKKILDSKEFPDLKSHNIYWGIMCLPEDGRLFGKTPNLREMGVDSDVILYGMSKDNSWNEDCVFIAINQEEMLLVKENSFYHMVCKNPDTEYVRYDKLFWTWKYEWGIDEDDEKLEELVLEIPDHPESEIVPCYYGTWKVIELLGQGDEAVQGASLSEVAGALSGVEYSLSEQDDGNLVCGIIPPISYYYPDDGFFGNEGAEYALGISEEDGIYYAYIRYIDNQTDSDIYGFAMQKPGEMIVLSKGGYLYRAERQGDIRQKETEKITETMEQRLKEDLKRHNNQQFYRDMIFRGKWGINKCLFSLEEKPNNIVGQTAFFPDEEELQGYWGLMSVDETTTLLKGTPTLYSMGVKGDILYYYCLENNEWNGVFLVIDNYRMLYIEGNSIYAVRRFHMDHDTYVRDRPSA